MEGDAVHLHQLSAREGLELPCAFLLPLVQVAVMKTAGIASTHLPSAVLKGMADSQGIQPDHCRLCCEDFHGEFAWLHQRYNIRKLTPKRRERSCRLWRQGRLRRGVGVHGGYNWRNSSSEQCLLLDR